MKKSMNVEDLESALHTSVMDVLGSVTIAELAQNTPVNALTASKKPTVASRGRTPRKPRLNLG